MITDDFLSECAGQKTMSDIGISPKEQQCQPRFLEAIKIAFRYEGELKAVSQEPS